MISELFEFLEFHSKWLFAILVYQTFLLAIILFYFGRWNNSRPKLILSFFMLISGIIFLAFLFQHTGRIRLSGALNILLPAGFLVLMPFAYIYLRASTGTKFKTGLNEMLHFTPAIMFFIADLTIAFVNRTATYDLMKPGDSPLAFSIATQSVLWGQLVFYSYQSIMLLKVEKVIALKSFSISRFLENKWLMSLFLSFGIFSLLMTIMVFDSMIFNKQTDDIIFYILGFIIVTLLIGLFAIKNKDLQLNQIQYSSVNISPKVWAQTIVSDAPKHNVAEHTNNKSQLTPDKIEELKAAISNLMEKKCYTDPKISVDVIARKINSNSKYVSQVFNDSFGSSFTQYINHRRIEAAKKLLCEHDSGRYSIEGVGTMVGFQSKSTFNTQFKKFTGMTPSEYLKKVKESS